MLWQTTFFAQEELAQEWIDLYLATAASDLITELRAAGGLEPDVRKH